MPPEAEEVAMETASVTPSIGKCLNKQAHIGATAKSYMYIVSYHRFYSNSFR